MLRDGVRNRDRINAILKRCRMRSRLESAVGPASRPIRCSRNSALAFSNRSLWHSGLHGRSGDGSRRKGDGEKPGSGWMPRHTDKTGLLETAQMVRGIDTAGTSTLHDEMVRDPTVHGR